MPFKNTRIFLARGVLQNRSGVLLQNMTYAIWPSRESEEDGNKGEFNQESSAVDRDHENAVGMNEWEAIEGPHCTVQ